MKFLTGVTLSTLLLLSNSQEPIYLGNHALVTDHKRLLQFEGLQFREINQVTPILARRLQQGIYGGDDSIINRRRLQNNHYNVDHNQIQIQKDREEKEESSISKQDQKQINQEVEKPIFIIDRIYQQNSINLDHPITDPNIDGWNGYEDSPRPQKHQKHEKHEKVEKDLKEKKHGDKEHGDKKKHEYRMSFDEDQKYSSQQQRKQDRQERQFDENDQDDYGMFKGFMWAAGITLLMLILIKCCCKSKCGRNIKRCKRGSNLEEQINFHEAQIRRLEVLKRSQNVNPNMRIFNPYNQFNQQQQQQNNFAHQFNPYQEYENERIAFGQRPSPVYAQQNRNIPMGRPLPENSFEHSYPTL